MADQSTNDSPRREVKHEAVPGYLTVFLAIFAGLALYLAIILISSPGSAKAYKKSGEAAKSESGGSH